MSEPVLTRAELQGPVWKKLEKHMQDRLDAHRQKNDGDLPTEKTAKLRGQIAELKALLNIARETTVLDPEPPEPK